MLKSSALVLCISFVSLWPDSVHSSSCAQQEQECTKKCKEEKVKSENSIDIKNAGEDIDNELQADVLFRLEGIETRLHECLKSCANALKKCTTINDKQPHASFP